MIYFTKSDIFRE